MSKYVDTLTTFIDRQRTLYGRGNSEPEPGPEPETEWTIDGVTYHNRHIFDISVPMEGAFFDVLTGEELSGPADMEEACLYFATRSAEEGDAIVIHALYLGGDASEGGLMSLLNSNSLQFPAEYESKALECVETALEVTNESKIWLPTCSAFYGWLSEDKNTFIAYFNLKD